MKTFKDFQQRNESSVDRKANKDKVFYLHSTTSQGVNREFFEINDVVYSVRHDLDGKFLGIGDKNGKKILNIDPKIEKILLKKKQELS